jgi:hypothetical protein
MEGRAAIEAERVRRLVKCAEFLERHLRGHIHGLRKSVVGVRTQQPPAWPDAPPGKAPTRSPDFLIRVRAAPRPTGPVHQAQFALPASADGQASTLINGEDGFDSAGNIACRHNHPTVTMTFARRRCLCECPAAGRQRTVRPDTPRRRKFGTPRSRPPEPLKRGRPRGRRRGWSGSLVAYGLQAFVHPGKQQRVGKADQTESDAPTGMKRAISIAYSPANH